MVSTSLVLPDEPDVRVVDADPLGLVRQLKQEAGLGIWLCGGASLAASLFEEIDAVILKQYPVVAGSGIPLFRRGFDPVGFSLVDAKVYDSGVIVTTYRP